MIGSAIRAHRERLGLTLDRAAQLAHLPLERVGAIEGDAGVTVHELWALGNALAFDPAQLLREGSWGDPRRTAARFRAPAGVNEIDPEDARLLARAAEVGRIGAFLWAELDRPPGRVVELRQVKGSATTSEAWREGYQLGEAARQGLSPERSPIRSIQALLEDAGVHCATVALCDSEHHAVAVYEPDALPVVLLNENAARVQQPLSRRAILAHELCHLLHDGGRNDIVTLISRQASIEPYEQRANGFAPAFLAPPAWLSVAAETAGERVREIAAGWGLSYEGAVWHAKNCRLISAGEAEQLARSSGRVAASGWEAGPQRLSPGSAGLDISASPLVAGLLQDLIVRAFRKGVVSSGRARELLRFS